MSDRTRRMGIIRSGAKLASRRVARPRVEGLEARDLPATLAPIADVIAPATLGFQVALDGGATGDQTYTVTSSNAAIPATVAQGRFLTVGVSHVSSGANDPSFVGSLTFQLFEDLTPLTTLKIEQLVNEGFYTSPTTVAPILPTKNFHRIVSGFADANGFIVQGGSQTGNGGGSLNAPGFPFRDEFNPQLAFTGTGQLAMANAGDDTNDSQFFITTGSPRFLDFQHNIFGQLVAGSQTLTQMTQVARDANGLPTSPVLFTSTTLSTTNPDGVIHLDLTGAAPGQTSQVTVTAQDQAGTTTTRTFTVTAAANNDAAGQPIIERPFLAPVQNQAVGTGQTAVFPITGVAPTPNDPLTYAVGGSVSSASPPAFVPLPATTGTATVDANGVVTVTPVAGFTGVINLVVGVRDQTLRGGTTSLTDAGNFDTQRITLTVTDGAVVNLKPIATNGFTAVPTGSPTPVQLLGNTANPGSAQTLQFVLASSPANGTVSNFDATTGTFTYTPNPGFLGNDTLQFQVRDVGDPGPSLDSDLATQTFVVTGANTGAVRLIDGVLVVTPPPKASLQDKSTNTVLVQQVGDNVQVLVNGVADINQPLASDLLRIVVFGTKNSDTISVSPSVTVPTTLDGGHGGDNNVAAGGRAIDAVRLVPTPQRPSGRTGERHPHRPPGVRQVRQERRQGHALRRRGPDRPPPAPGDLPRENLRGAPEPAPRHVLPVRGPDATPGQEGLISTRCAVRQTCPPDGPPLSFCSRRRSQVVRQRIANPLSPGSNPGGGLTLLPRLRPASFGE